MALRDFRIAIIAVLVFAFAAVCVRARSVYARACVRVCTLAYTAELEISGRRLRKRLTDVLGTVFSKAVGGLQRRYTTENVCSHIAPYITLLARAYTYICESVCMCICIYIYMLFTHLYIRARHQYR